MVEKKAVADGGTGDRLDNEFGWQTVPVHHLRVTEGPELKAISATRGLVKGQRYRVIGVTDKGLLRIGGMAEYLYPMGAFVAPRRSKDDD